MKYSKSTFQTFMFLVLGLTLVFAGAGCKPYTVLTVAEATRIAEGEAFDAVSFVEARWSDITSTIFEKGVDLSAVLAAMQLGFGQYDYQG